MAMPTQDICDAWNTGDGASIQTVFTWAAIKEEDQAYLAEVLECDLDESMNTFALMPKDELDVILGAERDGKPWGIATKGKIRRAFTAIKKAAGAEEPEAQTATTVIQQSGLAPATPPGRRRQGGSQWRHHPGRRGQSQHDDQQRC